MIATLKRFFRRKERIVRAEKPLPAEVAFMHAELSKPESWRPMAELTREDIEQLKQLLATPLIKKIDVILYNYAQQHLRDAASAPVADVAALSKFALGYRAGWERFKSFSVIDLTKTVESEQAADTGADGLEQHTP